MTCHTAKTVNLKPEYQLNKYKAHLQYASHCLRDSQCGRHAAPAGQSTVSQYFSALDQKCLVNSRSPLSGVPGRWQAHRVMFWLTVWSTMIHASRHGFRVQATLKPAGEIVNKPHRYINLAAKLAGSMHPVQ
jgi:hypothetical protein